MQNVIFLHIPKTGDTTLNTLLERVYWQQGEHVYTVKHFADYPEFTQRTISKNQHIHLLKEYILYKGAQIFNRICSVLYIFERNLFSIYSQISVMLL